MSSAFDSDRRMILGLTGLVGAAALVRAAHAGPLDPPAGPVAPTGKTLTQIEPRVPIGPQTTPGDASNVFTISQPGSYYLTGPIDAGPGQNGIRVQTSPGHVTIDLNGFRLRGSGISGGAGISIATVSGLSIGNGFIESFGQSGINSTATGTIRIERVIVYNNENNGMTLPVNAVVANCLAQFNRGAGFFGEESARFVNCSAFFCSGFGFHLNKGCSAEGCLADQNFGGGFNAVDGSAVLQCVAKLNSGSGIQLGSMCVATGNNCDQTGVFTTGTGVGINVTGNGNRIEGNHLTRAFRGIVIAGTGNLCVRNSAFDHAGGNYVIGGGNAAGPLVNAAGIAASTNPHANYEL